MFVIVLVFDSVPSAMSPYVVVAKEALIAPWENVLSTSFVSWLSLFQLRSFCTLILWSAKSSS
ncbi:hypothetical protein D9M68_835230 [compost metagenome]